MLDHCHQLNVVDMNTKIISREFSTCMLQLAIALALAFNTCSLYPDVLGALPGSMSLVLGCISSLQVLLREHAVMMLSASLFQLKNSGCRSKYIVCFETCWCFAGLEALPVSPISRGSTSSRANLTICQFSPTRNLWSCRNAWCPFATCAFWAFCSSPARPFWRSWFIRSNCPTAFRYACSASNATSCTAQSTRANTVWAEGRSASFKPLWWRQQPVRQGAIWAKRWSVKSKSIWATCQSARQTAVWG